MLPSHRKAHMRLWTVLAIAVPLILIVAALVKPVPLAKDPVRIDAAKGAAGK